MCASRRDGVKYYFYYSVTEKTELVPEAISILLKENNVAVVSNNFEIYVDLTILVADLADWI